MEKKAQEITRGYKEAAQEYAELVSRASRDIIVLKVEYPDPDEEWYFRRGRWVTLTGCSKVQAEITALNWLRGKTESAAFACNWDLSTDSSLHVSDLLIPKNLSH